MDITNNNFLDLTTKAKSAYDIPAPSSDVDDQTLSLTGEGINICKSDDSEDIAIINGEKVGIFGNLSDEEIEKIVKTKYMHYSSSDIENLKYDYQVLQRAYEVVLEWSKATHPNLNESDGLFGYRWSKIKNTLAEEPYCKYYTEEWLANWKANLVPSGLTLPSEENAPSLYINNMVEASKVRAQEAYNLYTYADNQAATVENNEDERAKLSLKDIKEKIFKLHNTTISFSDVDVTLPFNNTDGMFEYLNTNTKFVEIFKDESGNLPENIVNKTGITKAQLIAITKYDSVEDNIYDFFGTISRAFSDRKNSDLISWKEIRHLFYAANESELLDNIECSAKELQDKVNTYALKVQKEYQSLDNQHKLEFILDKTEDYLIASGMQDQLDAMYRLMNTPNGTTNPAYINLVPKQVCNVGQIGFAPLPANENGSYTYTENDYGVWDGDDDMIAYYADSIDGWLDAGIVLKSDYLNGNLYKWYEVVDTMVHELTHATAYKYYENGRVSSYGIDKINEQRGEDKNSYIISNQSYFPNIEVLKQLYEMSFSDEIDYDYYLQNGSVTVNNNGNIVFFGNSEVGNPGYCVIGNGSGRTLTVSLEEVFKPVNANDNSDLNKLRELVEAKIVDMQISARQWVHYYAPTLWGEYVAYQADSDYMDSIAGDIFDKYNTTIASIGTGYPEGGANDADSEMARINKHIRENYINGRSVEEQEHIPLGRWWTYV